jgi:hypothetical protein
MLQMCLCSRRPVVCQQGTHAAAPDLRTCTELTQGVQSHPSVQPPPGQRALEGNGEGTCASSAATARSSSLSDLLPARAITSAGFACRCSSRTQLLARLKLSTDVMSYTCHPSDAQIEGPKAPCRTHICAAEQKREIRGQLRATPEQIRSVIE